MVLPAKPGWPHPVPSPQRYACALHPREASGRLPGRTECDHAPNQWTPRLSGHPSTAGRSTSISLWSLSISSGLHHLGLSPPILHHRWLFAFRLTSSRHPFWYTPGHFWLYHFWQSGCRVRLVPRIVSLGRVHLGLSMLLLSSVCVLLHIHDVLSHLPSTTLPLTIASALSGQVQAAQTL